MEIYTAMKLQKMMSTSITLIAAARKEIYLPSKQRNERKTTRLKIAVRTPRWTILLIVCTLSMSGCQTRLTAKSPKAQSASVQCSLVQDIVTIPHTSQLLFTDNVGDRIMLVSILSNTASVISLDGTSDGVAVTSDGRTAFVATNSRDDAFISVLHIPDGAIGAKILLPARAVGGITAKGDGSAIFVLAATPQLTLLKVNPSTAEVISSTTIEGSTKYSPLRKPVFLSLDEGTVFILDAWRANGGSVLLAFDTATMQMTREIDLGRNVCDIAMSADKRVVAFSKNIRDQLQPELLRGEVKLLDLSAGLVTKSYGLEAGVLGLAFAPTGNALWAAHDQVVPGAFSRIDLFTDKIQYIKTYQVFPASVAKLPIGDMLYFVSVGKVPDGDASCVVGIDTNTAQLRERIELPNSASSQEPKRECPSVGLQTSR